jgi:hypothetical protein
MMTEPQHSYRPPPAHQQQHQPVPYQQAPAPHRQAPRPQRQPGLTAAGTFWYILGNVAFGAMYFAKVPAKKALADAGLATMTGAERFWYVLMCIAFGGGYFAKLPIAKAISEMQHL